jgi:hypothetical protein
MNERIRELWVEAGYHADAYDMFTNMEKFAELIVRECANIAEQKQTYNDGHGIHLNIDQCILSEFGVEK